MLRANDAGRYTVPSRATYPHQWNWDSALCALGWAELDPDRAWTELETLAAARDPEGMVPHIAFHTRLPMRLNGRVRAALARIVVPYARYLPGPAWWGVRRARDGRRISAITQPPVAATCLRLLFEEHTDEGRARGLLRALHGWHRFLLTTRDPHRLGEPVLIHPWESGRDNAVEWDRPLWRVVPTVAVLHRRDTVSVDAAERPSDDHYRRYLTLVRAGTDAGWPQERLARESPFRVLDAGFSAILARACFDLAWLAEELGESEVGEDSALLAARVAAALRARVGSDGLIRAVDLADGETLDAASAGSALAALAPDLPEPAALAARDLVIDGGLASPYGVRSLHRADPRLLPRNYWRGPVWANVTWLCARGLGLHGLDADATALRDRMLLAVAGGGMREYTAPDSGRGLGAEDFGWTAALALRELRGVPPSR